MPDTNPTIEDMARDYAEGSALAAALIARANIPPNPNPARSTWVRHWLDLSDWARQRELTRLENGLATALDTLRQTNVAAELRAIDDLRRFSDAEGLLRDVVSRYDPAGTSEVTQRLGETLAARDDAIRALTLAGEARCDYFAGRAAVELARLRARIVRQHFAELSHIRIRTAAKTFLVTLLLIAGLALVLHYRMLAR